MTTDELEITYLPLDGLIPYANNSRTHDEAQVARSFPACGDASDGAAHLWAADRKQTTVIACKRPSKSDLHPTMKPVELMEYQIENNTKGSDAVLDLFGGSGSTLIACEKTGRHARLMELDPKYVDVIVRRWCEFTGKQATHEATGATFAEVEADSALAVAEEV